MRTSKGKMARLFVISVAAVLVVASIGFATRERNSERTSSTVTLESASFHAVMVKLDGLEAEIQKSTRATEELRRALANERRQNARLFGLLASSSFRPGMFAAAPPPAPPKIVPTKLMLAIELCAKQGAVFAGKVAPAIAGEINLEGSLGANVFGTGLEGKGSVKVGVEAGLEAGAETGMELTACLSGVEVAVDAVDIPNFQALVNGMVAGWPTTAADISNVFVNQPLLQTANLGGTLNLINTVQTTVGPAAVANGLKSPQGYFSDYTTLLQRMPFLGNTGSVLNNPEALFPTGNDVTFNAFCTGVSPGTLLSDTCIKAQNFVSPLDPLANKLDTAEMKIASLQTGVTGYCNTVNNRLTTIRNGSIPGRNFSLNLGPVGTFNIPVDVVRTPFSSLTTVPCPVF